MKLMTLVALKKPPPADVFNFEFERGTAGDAYALPKNEKRISLRFPL